MSVQKIQPAQNLYYQHSRKKKKAHPNPKTTTHKKPKTNKPINPQRNQNPQTTRKLTVDQGHTSFVLFFAIIPFVLRSLPCTTPKGTAWETGAGVEDLRCPALSQGQPPKGSSCKATQAMRNESTG